MLWCGGNEFSPAQNAPVIETMQRAVAEEDDTRAFRPVSPAGGESHNWRIWHAFKPVEEYQRDTAQIMSEFGLQALPARQAMERFIPAEDLWPPGPSWKYHRAQVKKLRHYAQAHQAAVSYTHHAATELDAFVEATQLAQARGIQIAVEHTRRRKYATSGFFVWQLNSPWPGVDWALVDYYRNPKEGYEKLREVANPLLVSLDYPLRRYAAGEVFEADVWLINDWWAEVAGARAEVSLVGSDTSSQVRSGVSTGDQTGGTRTFTVHVKPDSAEIIGHARWTLRKGDRKIVCKLIYENEVVSTNSYVLSM
jgi:hypothetical protein